MPAEPARRRAGGQVVVDDAARLHRRVGGDRADEPEPERLELLGQRLGSPASARARRPSRRGAGTAVRSGACDHSTSSSVRPAACSSRRARPLAIVASILARLRTMPASAISRATSSSPNSATTSGSKSANAVRNAGLLRRTVIQARPGLEALQGEPLVQGVLVVHGLAPLLVVVLLVERVAVAEAAAGERDVERGHAASLPGAPPTPWPPPVQRRWGCGRLRRPAAMSRSMPSRISTVPKSSCVVLGRVVRDGERARARPRAAARGARPADGEHRDELAQVRRPGAVGRACRRPRCARRRSAPRRPAAGPARARRAGRWRPPSGCSVSGVPSSAASIASIQASRPGPDRVQDRRTSARATGARAGSAAGPRGRSSSRSRQPPDLRARATGGRPPARSDMRLSTSSLDETYRYSDIVVNPSDSASRAIETASSPSASASAMPASAICSSVRPGRGPGRPGAGVRHRTAIPGGQVASGAPSDAGRRARRAGGPSPPRARPAAGPARRRAAPSRPRAAAGPPPGRPAERPAPAPCARRSCLLGGVLLGLQPVALAALDLLAGVLVGLLEVAPARARPPWPPRARPSPGRVAAARPRGGPPRPRVPRRRPRHLLDP